MNEITQKRERQITIEALERRLTALELELAQLRQRAEQDKISNTKPWIDVVFGVFKDDPLFNEAERYGREWRNSQHL